MGSPSTFQAYTTADPPGGTQTAHPGVMNWDPAYSGSYSLVWELHVEGLRLHTGGELKKVSGVVQNAYARLSPAPL